MKKAFMYEAHIYELTRGPHGKDNAWIEGKRTAPNGVTFTVSICSSEVEPPPKHGS